MHRFMYTLKYPSSVLDESSSCSICIVPVHAVAKWVPLWHRVLDTICIKEQISRTSTIAIDLASCQCGEKPTTSCQSVTHKTTPLDASYNLRFGLCEKKNLQLSMRAAPSRIQSLQNCVCPAWTTAVWLSHKSVDSQPNSTHNQSDLQTSNIQDRIWINKTPTRKGRFFPEALTRSALAKRIVGSKLWNFTSCGDRVGLLPFSQLQVGLMWWQCQNKNYALKCIYRLAASHILSSAEWG